MWQTGLTKHTGFQHFGSNPVKKKKTLQSQLLENGRRLPWDSRSNWRVRDKSNRTEMLEDCGSLAMTPPPAPSSPLYRLLRLHWCPLSGPTCRQWGLPPDASSHSAPGLPVSWRTQKQNFHDFNVVTQDADQQRLSVLTLIRQMYLLNKDF